MEGDGWYRFLYLFAQRTLSIHHLLPPRRSVLTELLARLLDLLESLLWTISHFVGSSAGVCGGFQNARRECTNKPTQHQVHGAPADSSPSPVLAVPNSPRGRRRVARRQASLRGGTPCRTSAPSRATSRVRTLLCVSMSFLLAEGRRESVTPNHALRGSQPVSANEGVQG